jgi:nucleotide-binding universal stress UspA family protein
VIPSTIVVPLDGSEFAQRAVPVATSLAARSGAEVLFMSTPWDEDAGDARRYLEAVAGFANGVPVQVSVVPGAAPADAIGQVVDEGPDRMVCMTTHGRGRFRWAVAGSVAEEVIRAATRPLLLVGQHALPMRAGSPGQVVACIDDSPAAEAALGPACEWARALDCEMTLAHVPDPHFSEDPVPREAFIDRFEERVRREGLPLHTRIAHGYYVTGALLDVVSEPPATLIVMAARGRKGVARAVLGSVTMGVVNSAPCPVLVVPPGFGAASETMSSTVSGATS